MEHGSGPSIQLSSESSARADELTFPDHQLLHQCIPGIGTFPIKLNLSGHISGGLPEVSSLGFVINGVSNEIRVDSTIIEVSNMGL